MKSDRMTIRDIAGFCPEEAVWKMMTDVCTFLLKENSAYVLNPDTIVVDGNLFLIEEGVDRESEFLAPEQEGASKEDFAQFVWQIGSVAYYVATGHIVFGGRGGTYQREHPHVALPVLPKSYQALTPVIQSCLSFHPAERISLEKLKEKAEKGLTACLQSQREKATQTGMPVKKDKKQKEKWPEDMIGI